MTITKPKPLQIEHDRRTMEPPYNSVELSARDSFVISAMRAFPYRLTVWSDGFEAHVDLNADCLRAMREWIDEALEGGDGRAKQYDEMLGMQAGGGESTS